jgi:hypothetical protein
VSDGWLDGTRPLVTPDTEPAVIIVLENDEAVGMLDDVRAAVAAGAPVEVRSSFAGPSRSGTAVAHVVVIVQQVGLATTGAGLWAAVELTVRTAFRRRKAVPGDMSQQVADDHEPAQSLTVVIPTARGPALIRRVSVGPQNLDEAQLSVERIARALAEADEALPQA